MAGWIKKQESVSLRPGGLASAKIGFLDASRTIPKPSGRPACRPQQITLTAGKRSQNNMQHCLSG
ncbi:MAG: hypothetical protein WA147_13835 [Polaromonas sp.]